MLISVIVSTYNRPDALEAVLLSLLEQTDTRYEIIIADDGSAEPTQEVVRRFQATAAQARRTRSSAPQVIHAWHSDDGFRLSAARNLGVHASAGDYLIFLDGDCVVRPNFVARHRTLAEAGFMVSGSRVLRSSMLDVMNEDYVRTARAKGLNQRKVMTRHVLRNSLIPVITLFGLDFGVLIGGGAIVTETLFNIEGVGLFTAEALKQQDFPSIMAITLFGAFFIVLFNILVDVAYAYLDPRIRIGASAT